MEPALDERGDLAFGAGLAAEEHAAMEPALDERGDVGPRGLPGIDRTAAMEPALDERGDLIAGPCWASWSKPQWSPLSTSGATRTPTSATTAPGRRNGARSRRAGRRQTITCRDANRRAAMEPALDERGDLTDGRHVLGERVAAMEPALDERGDKPGRSRRRRPRGGRNGARSRRAGRPTSGVGHLGWAHRPQWSPLSTSGATWRPRTPLSRRERCRNGARSRRAGRPGAVHPGRRVGRHAAMEPALDERGDLGVQVQRQRPGGAAMEPALDERGDLPYP